MSTVKTITPDEVNEFNKAVEGKTGVRVQSLAAVLNIYKVEDEFYVRAISNLFGNGAMVAYEVMDIEKLENTVNEVSEKLPEGREFQEVKEKLGV
jgi:hypothetical protein